jgi:hypothetical protein
VADRFTSHASFAAVLIFAVAFLSPMLRSGFYCDDIKNSCTAGFIRLSDSSLATVIEQCTLAAMQGGRLFPGALATTFAIHFLFTSAAAYKGFILALTLANLVQFYALLRCWKVHPAAAQLATLALVLLLQMRASCDPLLGFAGIMQIVTGQLLLSMICLQRYLESARRAWLVSSVLIYVSSLLTYEISYLFLPIYLAMAVAHCGQWRRALATVGPHALATGVLTCYVLGLRFSVPMDAGSPYRFSLAPSAVAATALKQASAALPLSYALLSLHRPDIFDALRALSRWDSWLIALAAGALTWVLLRKIPGDPQARQGAPLKLLFAAGLMIWILPGMAIAASPKYQTFVLAGIGYLPVYVQYCGVPLVAVAGLLWLIGRYPDRRARLAFAVILTSAWVALITFDTNRDVVDRSASLTSNCRGQQLFEAALSAGLADDIPEGATVITAGAESIPLLDIGPPLSSAYITQQLQRKINSISDAGGPGTRSLGDQLAGLKPAAFVLSVHCVNDQSGFVIVGSIDPNIADPDVAQRSARNFRVFLCRMPKSAAREDVVRTFGGWWAGSRFAREDPDPQVIDVSQLRLLRSGPDWAIFEGSFARPSDVATAQLRMSSAVASRRPDEQISMADSADD